MKYIVTTKKPINEATAAVESATANHDFGVLGIHDLQATMHKKGVDFPHACRVLEVCNPAQASRVLSSDMSLNMLLPCRISVYEDGGETKIGTILPSSLLGAFSDSDDLGNIAQEVEDSMRAIIDEAA